MATATATKPKTPKSGGSGKKNPVPHDDVATPVEQPETETTEGTSPEDPQAESPTVAPQTQDHAAEPPKNPPVDTAAPGDDEPIEDKKIRLIREEKERLEELICGQSQALDEATTGFNVSNERTKSTVAKLEEHGFSTLGSLKDEIEVGGNFEDLDGIGDTQVKKIHKALDLWIENHPGEFPASGTADIDPDQEADSPPVTEGIDREGAKAAYEEGCGANADGKPITDNPYKPGDERVGHWNDGWNETEKA